MEIGDSPEEAAFRAEAYDWLASKAALRADNRSGPRSTHGDQASLRAELERARAWQRTLYDGGWAGITLPEEYGGRGGTGLQQVIFNEEMAKFDVSVGGLTVALAMVVPTLIAHGTEEQKDLHIDRILRGEELWCQLYSEPGAGSDLASLSTRAVLDGDEYVVNGQKVWNSFAQLADYGILLARTDPDQPKNRGITYFIVDMATEGVEARPLRQITGIAHFNEVFLADARVPATNVVGEVGEGWRVAQTTLANERAMIGGGGAGNLTGDIVDLARRYGKQQDPLVRQSLAQAVIRARTIDYLGYRLRTAMSRGVAPGPEASILKLAYSRHMASTGDLVLQVLGPDATLWGADAPDDSRWQDYFLSQYTVRLGGGTDEIQKNVIAERALGLPREPMSDRDVPWRSLPRS
jgi:alkylation response protein AidB-like acyl-CoA dehydrogenase